MLWISYSIVFTHVILVKLGTKKGNENSSQQLDRKMRPSKVLNDKSQNVFQVVFCNNIVVLHLQTE